MVRQLWAPWRLSYVATHKPDGCVFCTKPVGGDDDEALIVARREHCYVVLNLFPYNNGHLMAVPYRHVADLCELTEAESRDLQLALCDAIAAMRRAMHPEGFNVGLNLGDAAGAGIAQHLHWHVVPRWNGDTNFMPVIADTKVMPQHLLDTLSALRDAFQEGTETTTTSGKLQ